MPRTISPGGNDDFRSLSPKLFNAGRAGLKYTLQNLLLAILNTYDHYNESTSKLKTLFLYIFHEALVLNF